VAGIPRLPMLIQSYEDFAKADAVLKPYVDKAYQEKGSTLLASYTYPLQFMWGRKKLESLADIKGMKLRVAQPEQGEFVRRPTRRAARSRARRSPAHSNSACRSSRRSAAWQRRSRR